MKHCQVCEKPMPNATKRQLRCSYNCILEFKRQESLKKRNGVTMCVICKTKFKSNTTKKRTCSDICRQKLKVSQNKSKMREVETATDDVRMRNKFLLAKRA